MEKGISKEPSKEPSKELSDQTLLRIALCTAFIGLIALFIIMYYSVIPEKSINQINDSDLGKKIKLQGNIETIRYSSNNKTTFISLTQKCSITVVSFKKLKINDSNIGGTIVVEGSVQEYNSKKELIADKIYLK